MPPVNPKFATIEADEKRLAVPQYLVPGWFADRGESPVYCIPLLWLRDLPLPPGRELEAWYIWGASDPTQNWVTNPNEVIEANGAGNAFYLRATMYEASITCSKRQYKFGCSGLITYLQERAGLKLWITNERNSIGILTDFAFHVAYGRLRL